MLEIVIEAYSWSRCPNCHHAFETTAANHFFTDKAGLPPKTLAGEFDLESLENWPRTAVKGHLQIPSGTNGHNQDNEAFGPPPEPQKGRELRSRTQGTESPGSHGLGW